VDDRLWKNVSILLGVACALLIGIAGALLIVGHKSGGSTSPTDTPSASEVASAPTPRRRRLAAAAWPSRHARPPRPRRARSARPRSPSTAWAWTPRTDTSGSSRTFQFLSDGAGSVTFAITKISAGGTAKLCIKVDTGAFTCQVGTSGKMPNFPKGKSDPGTTPGPLP